MSFLDFLAEQQNNEQHDTYDRSVFTVDINGNMGLKDSVLRDLEAVARHVDELVPIENAYVLGDICTRKYNDTTPIDVAILVDRNDINDVVHDKLMSTIVMLNKHFVADTRHPLNAKIELVDGINGAKAWIKKQKTLFSIRFNKWLKKEEDIEPNIFLVVKKLIENEPTDLVFFDKENPVSVDFFYGFTKDILEKIKGHLKQKLFDLIREANGISSNTIEKNFVKDALTNQSVDCEKLQLKFVSNDISEQLAMNLLKQNYYYELLDMISSAKAGTTVENDFDSSLTTELTKRVKLESVEPRHPTFSEYVITENKAKIKKLKKLAKLIEPGKGGKSQKANKAAQHENLALKQRNMQRKRLRQLAAYRELTKSPVEQISDEFSCKTLIQRAKDVPRGFWLVNPMQAKWLAMVYHFDLPTNKDRIKRLSNMPMALFKPRRGGYFLVKDERLNGIS